VIIGLMIFFAVGLIVILIRYYRNWSTKEAKEEKVEEKTEPIDTTKLLQAGQQADELAKHNNIIEAMHTLLLDTIQELKNQKKQTFPDSFTSREIASKLNIGTAANKALDEIVTIVEPTWFGNYLPALTEYKVLRKKYDTFLLLLGGRKQPEL
jgi:hypothetical protein